MPHNLKEKRAYRRGMRRRALAYLGNKCVECGSTRKLEFHHKNAADKAFNINYHLFPTAFQYLTAELDKCELRCKPCHVKAHAPRHGSLAMYNTYKCRCALCTRTERAYHQAWRAKQRMYHELARG